MTGGVLAKGARTFCLPRPLFAAIAAALGAYGALRVLVTSFGNGILGRDLLVVHSLGTLCSWNAGDFWILVPLSLMCSMAPLVRSRYFAQWRVRGLSRIGVARMVAEGAAVHGLALFAAHVGCAAVVCAAFSVPAHDGSTALLTARLVGASVSDSVLLSLGDSLLLALVSVLVACIAANLSVLQGSSLAGCLEVFAVYPAYLVFGNVVGLGGQGAIAAYEFVGALVSPAYYGSSAMELACHLLGYAAFVVAASAVAAAASALRPRAYLDFGRRRRA